MIEPIEKNIKITTFADIAGVSQQAIDQAAKHGKLMDYTSIVDGRRLISTKGLELYGVQVIGAKKGQLDHDSSEEVESSLKDQIDTLKQLVTVLQNQLQAKDNQLDRMHTLLDQQQRLQLAQLPEPKKSHWWQRLFSTKSNV